jgi:RNA-directed DNA polymerase
MAASSFSPRVPVPVSLQDLFKAWQHARKGKIPSNGQLAFDARWLDGLLALQAQLNAGDWQPTRTVAFIVDRPKTREIHAPAFADRIVHHWLIDQLEPLFEPVFIHDSFANRRGKGSHAAVDRLQAFMRSRNGQGHYLQLDVHNCFNSIHRGVLYQQLCARLLQCERRALVPQLLVLPLRSLCHKLLVKPAPEFQAQPERALTVPAHKLLRNAKPGCGIPVGNLSSQFFVNVYLNALDQFVKHELKVKHYVRYVDDFVLLADTPGQLREWQARIETFLGEKLLLRLKNTGLQQALCQGIDFLGYRVFATHRGFGRAC